MTRPRRTIPLVPAGRPAAAECERAIARARETTYVRALYRACLILGGLAPLAKLLSVSRAELARWLQGIEEPPLEVFLAVVEVLLLDAEAGGRAS